MISGMEMGALKKKKSSILGSVVGQDPNSKKEAAFGNKKGPLLQEDAKVVDYTQLIKKYNNDETLAISINLNKG